VIIETVARAAEEARPPHVSVPRGLILAQITLVALVLFTWWFASAAVPYAETAQWAIHFRWSARHEHGLEGRATWRGHPAHWAQGMGGLRKRVS